MFEDARSAELAEPDPTGNSGSGCRAARTAGRPAGAALLLLALFTLLLQTAKRDSAAHRGGP